VREIRAKLAEALTNGGRGAEAAELRLALATDEEPLRALDLRRRAAEQFMCSGHFDRGLVLLRSVLEATGARFPQSPITLLVWLLVVRVVLRMRGVTFEEGDASRLGTHALVRIDATRSAAAGFSMSDNVLGAYFQTTNLLLALKAGDPPRVMHALAMEVCFTSAGGVGARARVQKLLASARALHDRVKTPEAEGILGLAISYSHYFTGEWREAKSWLDRTDDTLRDKCLGFTFEANSARAMLYRSMCNLGALRELGERVPGAMREVERQGDLYSEINLRTTAVLLLGLAHDEPDRVGEELERARGHLARSRFLVQHYFCVIGQAQLHLYRGEGEAAHAEMARSWPALRRSLLLRIQAIRVFAIDQRARCAIMAARESSSRRNALLAAAESDARRLAREGAPWAAALGELLRAGVADVRGDAQGAASHFALAIAALDATDMALYAAAARRRHGELLGGAEGSALVDAAGMWMEGQTIRHPGRMTRMLVPSFDAT
jgi:hypothetical protein